MRRLLPALAILLAQTVCAADFTGHWLSVRKTSDGQTHETSLWLKADGNRLSGYLTGRDESEPLSEGKITGNEISFVIVRDEFGKERRILYHGSVTGQTLHLQMTRQDGSQSDSTFQQISRETPPPLPAARPKITLP